MSDLHFDADGEPARVPADAEELRVRRFRKPGERGACEVVHGADGAPLFVPIDATYLEFRKLVDSVPGRYRLDPVDATRRACSGAVALYVTIDPTRNANGAADDRDGLSRDLVRAHVEMMRVQSEAMNNIASHFASMMTATAEILRAADGAGLPRRQAAPTPEPNDVEDDELEDDVEEEDIEPPHPLSPLIEVLAGLIEQNASTITAYATAKITGLGTADQNASGAGTSSVEAAAPSVSAVNASPATEGPIESSPIAATTPAVGSAPAAHTSTAEAPVQASTSATSPDTATAGARNAATVEARPTVAQTAHLIAIRNRLTPEENAVLIGKLTHMSGAERSHWMREVCARSVDDALALVRSKLPPPTEAPNKVPTKEHTP